MRILILLLMVACSWGAGADVQVGLGPNDPASTVWSGGSPGADGQIMYASGGKTTSNAKMAYASGTGSVNLGGGIALGAPTGTPALAAAAGALTGVYQYAYTETDAAGETTISPTATITLTGQGCTVTLPLMRRGVAGRKLYRTVAGGSTFFLVHTMADGHYTQYLDTTADGSLGAQAPASDTTKFYDLEVNDGVKRFRTHPNQGTAAADLTMLTGDPATNGAWAIDAYQTITAKVPNSGTAFYGRIFGTAGQFIQCQAVGVLDDGSGSVTKFQVGADGSVTAQGTVACNAGMTSTNGTFTGTVKASSGAQNELVGRFNVSNEQSGLYAGSNGQSYFGTNLDYSAGDTYSRGTVPAARWGNPSASTTVPFELDVAAPGTAAAAVTWTTSFTTDTSGNVTFNGNVAATAATASLTLGSNSATAPVVLVNGAAGNNRYAARLQTAGVKRWELLANNTAEGGSDAGSDFRLAAYTDAGAFIDFPLQVTRAAGGTVTVPRPLRSTDTTASTSGSTGALQSSGGIGAQGAIWSSIAPAAATTPAFGAAGTAAVVGSVTDSYQSGIRLSPGFSGAQTVTRLNYIDLNNATLSSTTLTDACVFRLDAAVGTHKAADSGTTKTTPGTVNGWLKVNVNGTLYYIPMYTSKTSMLMPSERLRLVPCEHIAYESAVAA